MRTFWSNFFVSKPDAAVDAADVADACHGGKDGTLKLPRRRKDVEDWIPPVPRHAPACEQAQVLVALFQSEERFGPIPHWDLEASYKEIAWLHGFIQITKLQLARALGAICTKVRLDVLDENGCVIRAAHYVIPEPFRAENANPQQSEPGNVVPIGTKRSKIPSGSRLSARSSEGKSTRAKARARKGGAHRADIREAVACNI